MLLYISDGLVVAWHEDSRYVLPDLYGNGVRVVPIPNDMSVPRVGTSPVSTRVNPTPADHRSRAAPAPTRELLLGYAAFKAERIIGGWKIPPSLLDQAPPEKIERVRSTLAMASAAVNAFTASNWDQVDAFFNGL